MITDDEQADKRVKDQTHDNIITRKIELAQFLYSLSPRSPHGREAAVTIAKRSSKRAACMLQCNRPTEYSLWSELSKNGHSDKLFYH